LNMEEEFRRKDKGNDVVAGGWETIYCSLALILVALFAMLVSYSTFEGERLTNFMRGFSTMAREAGTSTMDDSVERSLIMEGGKDTVSSSVAALTKYYSDAGLGKSIDIERTEKGFRTTFGSGVLFSSGDTVLSKSAYPYIDKMIEMARQIPYYIRVEGHTDNVPINTSEFPSNWELSTARAVNVLRYFLKKGTIAADRLSAVGFSRYHPLMSNESDEGRKINRRVDFYFSMEEGKKSN